MAVSKNYTEHPIALVADLYEQSALLVTAIKRFEQDHEKWENVGMSRRGIDKLHDVVHLAAHRLAWLEAVVKGLTYQAQHDASVYARFVDEKHNIEDMDVEELRVLLREK